MNEEDRRLGNDRKTLLVEDCVNIGPKENSILSVINGCRPQALLILCIGTCYYPGTSALRSAALSIHVPYP
jgi:hypothetical protein